MLNKIGGGLFTVFFLAAVLFGIYVNKKNEAPVVSAEQFAAEAAEANCMDRHY